MTEPLINTFAESGGHIRSVTAECPYCGRPLMLPAELLHAEPASDGSKVVTLRVQGSPAFERHMNIHFPPLEDEL